MTKLDQIIELITEKRDKAKRAYEEYKQYGANSYGTGVEWGEYEACCKILEEIKEIRNNNK